MVVGGRCYFDSRLRVMIAGVLRVSLGLHKQILVVEFDYEHYPVHHGDVFECFTLCW